MKYRKKPIIIEAVQFTPQTVMQIYKFINGENSVVLKSDMDYCKWDDYENSIIKNGYDFKTLESDGETQKAVIGDWVIKGINGEFYPCKPDIFEKTYEAVSSHPEQGEQGDKLRNDAELFWHKHRVTFKGVNGGDYIDKEDWDKFINTLCKLSSPPPEGQNEYEKGYADGWRDATKEAAQEIREHYKPNNE